MGSCHGKEEFKKDVNTPKSPQQNGTKPFSSGKDDPTVVVIPTSKSKIKINDDGIDRVSMYSESGDSASPQAPLRTHSDVSNLSPIEKSLVVSTYRPTGMVKPKGHRIRIEPSLTSRPVHLVVPPTPLLVIDHITKDNMTWGKVHPNMFPPNFKGCEINSDGWCLLIDSREKEDVVTYWILESSTSSTTTCISTPSTGSPISHVTDIESMSTSDNTSITHIDTNHTDITTTTTTVEIKEHMNNDSLTQHVTPLASQ